MSLKKKLFGVFLIILSFSSMFLIAYLEQILGNPSGKVNLNKQLQSKPSFIQSDSDYYLIYFGYVGCDSICVPSLSEINHIYNGLNSDFQKKVKVYFVNIKTSIDKDLVDNFAKHFNKNFMGIYLNELELKNISKEFDLKYSTVVLNKFEIDHKGYLYLLKKDKNSYLLKQMYTNRPLNIESITNDLNSLK
jgi:protein SCO1/2